MQSRICFLVPTGYGDFAFRQGFDNVSSTIKVRQAGFHECLDSETMFSQFFGKLRETKLLPAGMRSCSDKA